MRSVLRWRELAERLCVENMSINDRFHSELRLWVAEIEGASSLFAAEVVRLLEWSIDDGVGHLRASPRLSSLTLETSNALLPPFGSHLVGGLGVRSAAAIDEQGVDGEASKHSQSRTEEATETCRE